LKTVALGLINDLDLLAWDIVLLQEPYIYPNLQLTIASPDCHIVYPHTATDSPPLPPNLLILVNVDLGSSIVTQIPIPSNSIMAIVVQAAPDVPTVNLYNIYNPPNMDTTLDQLQQWLDGLDPPTNMI